MKIGDFVSFVSATGSGIVSGFLPNGEVLVEEGGMEIPYMQSELVVLDGSAIAANNGMVNSFAEEKVYSKPKMSRKGRKAVEIDLHAEKLPSYLRGLRVRNICEKQVRYFLDVLKENVGKHGMRFVFIHGKGAGILREELKRELNKRKSQFVYNAANYLHYDFNSALEVVVL